PASRLSPIRDSDSGRCYAAVTAWFARDVAKRIISHRSGWVSDENPLSPHQDGNCCAPSRTCGSCGCRCRAPVHCWAAVGSAPTAAAVLDAVRDAARNVDAPNVLCELIDAAFDDCDQDRTLAAPLTDALLDIRNSSRVGKPRPPSDPVRSDQSSSSTNRWMI